MHAFGRGGAQCARRARARGSGTRPHLPWRSGTCWPAHLRPCDCLRLGQPIHCCRGAGRGAERVGRATGDQDRRQRGPIVVWPGTAQACGRDATVDTGPTCAEISQIAGAHAPQARERTKPRFALMIRQLYVLVQQDLATRTCPSPCQNCHGRQRAGFCVVSRHTHRIEVSYPQPGSAPGATAATHGLLSAAGGRARPPRRAPQRTQSGRPRAPQPRLR